MKLCWTVDWKVCVKSMIVVSLIKKSCRIKGGLIEGVDGGSIDGVVVST